MLWLCNNYQNSLGLLEDTTHGFGKLPSLLWPGVQWHQVLLTTDTTLCHSFFTLACPPTPPHPQHFCILIAFAVGNFTQRRVCMVLFFCSVRKLIFCFCTMWGRIITCCLFLFLPWSKGGGGGGGSRGQHALNSPDFCSKSLFRAFVLTVGFLNRSHEQGCSQREGKRH